MRTESAVMPARRSPEQTSAIMRRVRSTDTAPEVALRKALWRHGLRYRTGVRSLPGAPDLVFPRHRLALFVDGDFWHGRQPFQRGLTSVEEQFSRSPHRGYWVNKIERNCQRDRLATHSLARQGWRVLRLWATDVGHDLDRCVQLVLQSVGGDLSSSNGHRLPETHFPALTAVEFFSGIGLMRLALERSGWRILFANDIDDQKAEVYRDNFPVDDTLRLCDIRSLSADEIPAVSLATASFPCNDLSLAGKWRGINGTHSSTFWVFADLLEHMGSRAPRLILVENVPGFLNSHDGQDLFSALRRLNSLRYSCDMFLLDAAFFVPQSRPRLFIVASRAEPQQRTSVLTPNELAASPVRPKRLLDFIRTHPEVHWSLRPVPVPPRATPPLDAILEDVPDSSALWWSRQRADYMFSQLSDRHRLVAEQMLRGSTYSYATVFRRVRNGRSMAELRADGIAGCLRTPRGGSGRQILFKAGKGRYQVRLLNARECARLQGAPDTFLANVPLNQALFGFGDAVCVPVIEWILKFYILPLFSELLRSAEIGPLAD